MSERYVRKGNTWRTFGKPPIPIVPERRLILDEQFTGTAVDETRWAINEDTYGAGNIEDHWYQRANVVVSNGTCKLIAKKETVTGSVTAAPAMSYASSDGVNRAQPRTGLPAGSRPFSSGLLGSRDASTPRYYPLFSTFEIRARIPHGQGLLPAFWLRRNGGASFAEVDIMEYFFSYRPGQTKASLHFPNSLGTNTTQQRKHFEDPKPGISDWHTWSVKITPALTHTDPLKDPIVFEFFLDGEMFGIYRVVNEQTIRDLHMIDRTSGRPPSTGDREVWDVCVNLAVGGRWVGAPDQQLGYLPIPDRCSRTQQLPENGPASCDLTDLFYAQFPATFEIDYIKIYDLGY